MINIYKIDARKWTGASGEISDEDPCPSGWVRCEIEPQSVGDEFVGRTLGWRLATDNSGEIEAARLESLYQAAMRQQTASCDANFYGLLIAVGALSQGTGQAVPEKASSCIAWLETLWSDYHARKASGSTDYDFSSYGKCPYSFLEVRGE